MSASRGLAAAPVVRGAVTAVVAEPPDAARHFAAKLAFETDPADVAADQAAGRSGFVVVDARSAEAYAAGHVPGAVNLPHGRINERNLAAYDPATLFVTYCAGPHCNGADKGALRLAQLGRPV